VIPIAPPQMVANMKSGSMMESQEYFELRNQALDFLFDRFAHPED
jgi:hypothetical protein